MLFEFLAQEYEADFQKNRVEMLNELLTNVKAAGDVYKGIKTTKFSNKSYLETIHKFDIDTALLHSQPGKYNALENKLVIDQNNLNAGKYRINVDSVKPFKFNLPGDSLDNTNDIVLMPNSVKYRTLNPIKDEFKGSVNVEFTWLNSEMNMVTVIKKWGDGRYECELLKIPADGMYTFRYDTQKANNFNPKQFIFVFTNVSDRPTKEVPKCYITISKPDLLNPIYNKDFNKTLSILSGNEYKGILQAVYSVWKQRCETFDKKVCEQILRYNNCSSSDKEYTLKQVIESLKELNLSMQEAIVSVHDLRYQFYLRKNYIVSKICEGATSSSVLEQLKRLKEYQDDINAALSASSDQMISVIGSTVADHAMAYLMNTKSPLNPGWSAEENKVNQALQSVKSKIQNIWKKSPYYLNPSEAGDAFSAVGNPEFEIVFQMSGNKPAPINLPPNLKNEIFVKDVVYKVSDTIKKFTAVNYKEYLFGDVCDPMDWKYFSIIKKHDYREEFMPPQPGSPSYFRELNEIGYFRINAHKYEYENISLLPPDIISAVSRKFECFKRRTIDTIMIQLHKGQFELLSAIKKNIVNISAKDELTTILNGALAEIKSAAVVESNNTLCIGQTTEKINEILMLLNR